MSAPGSGGTSGGEHGERGNGPLGFRNRQGPAAQAVTVKPMEPSAQAQRGDTWHATVFGGFGLFWMSKACLLQWVLPATDPALRGDVSGCRPSPASWSSSSG